MGKIDFFNAVKNQQKILLDTNICIYYLENSPVYGEITAELFRLVQDGWIRAFLSVITALELLVKPIKAENRELENNIKLFLDHFPNLELLAVSREIAFQAAAIRAATNLKVPDAILIATATVNNCALIGNDLECSKKTTGIPYIYLDQYFKENST